MSTKSCSSARQNHQSAVELPMGGGPSVAQVLLEQYLGPANKSSMA
jgi:hypothetical protein